MKQRIHATAIVIAIAYAGPAPAQTTSSPAFQVVEATIDDIHMAFRSGRLTARQLVQSYLDRINAYDKQGPTINSVITLNPDALAEAGADVAVTGLGEANARKVAEEIARTSGRAGFGYAADGTQVQAMSALAERVFDE